MRRSVWQSQVNGILSLLFVGTFAVGAMLIIWQKAFNDNPLADQFQKYTTQETQLSQ